MNSQQDKNYKILFGNIYNKVFESDKYKKIDIEILRQICFLYYYEADYLTIYNFLINKNSTENNNIILNTTFALKNKYPVYNIDRQKVYFNKKDINPY